jgi:hypothetical protein
VEESLGPKREALQKKVKLFNEKNQAILNVSGGNAGNPGQNQANASSGTTRGGNPGSRTLCNPVFVPPDDAPTDYLRSVEPATTSPLQEFENTHQFLYYTIQVYVSNIYIYTRKFHMYIFNIMNACKNI